MIYSCPWVCVYVPCCKLRLWQYIWINVLILAVLPKLNMTNIVQSAVCTLSATVYKIEIVTTRDVSWPLLLFLPSFGLQRRLVCVLRPALIFLVFIRGNILYFAVDNALLCKMKTLFLKSCLQEPKQSPTHTS